jgi:hypothetical protein
MLETFGKILLLFGAMFVIIGGLLWGLGKAFGGGRLLPGDIVIHRPNFTFVFPIATSILLSLLLTFIFWLIGHFRR